MNILIVEDDAVHRAFLSEVLARTMPDCRVVEAEKGVVGEKLAQEHGTLHAVVDLQMPQRTGVDLARALWARRPSTSIVFWSNYADEAYVRGVSRIVPGGAAYGYILKSASEERLALALRGVFLEGQCIIDREIRSVQQRSVDRSESFTDVEYEILTDLALGLTDRLIAERRGLSLRSVQNRLQQVYDKLGVYDAEGGTEVFNLRMRAVALALLRKALNRESLEQADAALQDWLKRR